MAKVQVKKLVQDVESALGYPYVSPGNTSMSTIEQGVDCSGLLVAAFKAQGASLYHGSNTIWRKYLSEQGSIKDTKNKNYRQENSLKASQLELGMAVFKWNPSTPSKFKDDQGDYQHIGLVTHVNPLQITHASTEGMCVKTDYAVGKFCAWGKFKDVDYSTKEQKTDEGKAEVVEGVEGVEGVSAMYNAIVKCSGTLNVRNGAGTTYVRIGKFDNGTAIYVTEECKGNNGHTWAKASANGITGWVDTTYIEKVESTIDPTINPVDEPQIDEPQTDEPTIQPGQNASTLQELAQQIRLLSMRVAVLQSTVLVQK